MPILDVEIVLRPNEIPLSTLAGEIANRVGEIFGSAPGTTWVKVRFIPVEFYAENRVDSSQDVYPVFATILKAQLPSGYELQEEINHLTDALAQACDRPRENVHLQYSPAASGRVSFGGNIAS